MKTKNSNFSVGQFVQIKTQEGDYQGTILPSEGEDTIIIKLENGYNLGIAKKILFL